MAPAVTGASSVPPADLSIPDLANLIVQYYQEQEHYLTFSASVIVILAVVNSLNSCPTALELSS
jgi:hypothetical protein